jgi:hypothetical protein
MDGMCVKVHHSAGVDTAEVMGRLIPRLFPTTILLKTTMSNTNGLFPPPPINTHLNRRNIASRNMQPRANPFLSPSAERAAQGHLAMATLATYDPEEETPMQTSELYGIYKEIGFTVRIMESQIGSRPILPLHHIFYFDRQVEAVIWLRAIIRQTLDALVCELKRYFLNLCLTYII